MTTKQLTQWHLLKDTHVGAFNTTSELIDHTIKLQSEAITNQDFRKRAIAGTLFERYAIEYFEQIDGVQLVLDLNKTDDPDVLEYLEKIGLLCLVKHSNGTNNIYGIDLLCITSTGQYWVVQCKSTLNPHKNAPVDLIEGMMSLEGISMKNCKKGHEIDKWILFSPHIGASDILSMWDTLVVYGHHNLIPESGDAEAIKRDKLFFENIRLEDKSQRKELFKPETRGPIQKRIVDNETNLAEKRIRANGWWKHFLEICGGVGKSFLDPVVGALVELRLGRKFIEKLTGNTGGYANITFFHSTVTLDKNGGDNLNWRKGSGIQTDEGLVLAGADVEKGKYKKTTNSDLMAEWVIDGLRKGRTPCIQALMHHGDLALEVEEKIKETFPKFKWFRVDKDEVDLYWNPQSVYHKAHLLDAVWHRGSTATLIESDNPDFYCTNNVSKLGVKTSVVGMAEAEDAGLIKTSNIAIVRINASEVVHRFPDSNVSKDHKLDWNQTIKFDGVIPVQRDSQSPEYPTLLTLLTNMAVQNVLLKYPNNRQCIKFATKNITNILAELNWKTTAEQTFKRANRKYTKGEQELIDMHHQTFNDSVSDSITSKEIKGFKKVLSYAKQFTAFCLGSSKIAGRGMDDNIKPGTIINTAWWNGLKDIRTMFQEWLRVVRLDSARPDDEALIIQVTLFNDLDPDSSKHYYEDDCVDTFVNLLKMNGNLADEAYQFSKSGSSTSRRNRIKVHGFQKNITTVDISEFKNFLTNEVFWNNKNEFGYIDDDIIKVSNDWLKFKKEMPNPILVDVYTENQAQIQVVLEKTIKSNPWLKQRFADPLYFLRRSISLGYNTFKPETKDRLQKNQLEWENYRISFIEQKKADFTKELHDIMHKKLKMADPETSTWREKLYSKYDNLKGSANGIIPGFSKNEMHELIKEWSHNTSHWNKQRQIFKKKIKFIIEDNTDILVAGKIRKDTLLEKHLCDTELNSMSAIKNLCLAMEKEDPQFAKTTKSFYRASAKFKVYNRNIHCVHCDTYVSTPTFKKYHGDYCKHKDYQKFATRSGRKGNPKKVKTPIGLFNSIAEAREKLGVCRDKMDKLFKKDPTNYYKIEEQDA